MSEYAEKYRAEMREKAKKMGSPPPMGKVDSSDWSPEAPLKADVQTGMRPVSRQVFRAGGMVRGEPAKSHAGRKPRAAGGMTADDFVNRDVKQANEKREGEKHDGGMKAGGAAVPDKARLCSPPKKGAGLPEPKLRGALTQNERGDRPAKKAGGSLDGEIQGTRPTGGRLARKSGGKAKDKMNVNIIIAQPKSGPMPPMGGPPPGVPAPPPQMPQGAMGPPPMGRKSGGRASYPLTAGGGGGLGRLEKAKAYG